MADSSSFEEIKFSKCSKYLSSVNNDLFFELSTEELTQPIDNVECIVIKVMCVILIIKK